MLYKKQISELGEMTEMKRVIQNPEMAMNKPTFTMDGSAKWPPVITYKLKIMLGFLQIITNLAV